MKDARSSRARWFTVGRLRLAVQGLMFFALVYLGMFGVRRLTFGGIEPSLPTFSCEYGNHIAKCFLYDLQYILSRGADGYYGQLIEPTLFFIGLGLLLGRAWCGWVCPLGFLQDLITRLRLALHLPRLYLSPRARRGLRYTAYGVLIAMVVISLLTGWPSSRLYAQNTTLHRPYCQICPSRQLIPLVEANPAEFMRVDRYNAVTVTMGVLGIVALVTFLGGSFFIRQFWCRLCPLGLLMDVMRLNSWSMLCLSKNGERCTQCGSCARVCPVDIESVYRERQAEEVTQPECHLCLKCVESCPEDCCLSVRIIKWPVFTSSFEYFDRRQEGPGAE